MNDMANLDASTLSDQLLKSVHDDWVERQRRFNEDPERNWAGWPEYERGAAIAVLRVLADLYQSVSDEVDGKSEHGQGYKQAFTEMADGLRFNVEQIQEGAQSRG